MNGDFDKAYLRELAYKWKNGKLTAAEQQFLNDWENSHLDELLFLPDYSGGPEAVKQNMLNHLLAGMEAERVKTKTTKLWPRIITIAAAVAAIVFGVWFYHAHYTNDGHSELVSGAQYKNDIAPGKNTATITLPNGSIIQLSDAKTGVVIDPNSLKYNDGSLVQGASGTHFSGSLKGDQKNTGPVSAPSLGVNEMLTATTPRGGTYQFTLPDGTQVWLNAASKISFPSQFSGTNRKILLSGEAYFEVAKNKAKPFIVESNGQQVTVLGTHFNINAYTDEGSTKTTLLEGAVRVSSLRGGTTRQSHDDVVLSPDQQATNTGITIQVKQVNPAEAISWKDGKFTFNNTNLDEVLRQLARWYDVDIKYLGPIPNKQFSGDIYRNLNASEALELLKFTKVNFRIEGKTIIVSN